MVMLDNKLQAWDRKTCGKSRRGVAENDGAEWGRWRCLWSSCSHKQILDNASKKKTSSRKHKGLKLELLCIYNRDRCSHSVLCRHKPPRWYSPAECEVMGDPDTDELRDFLKLH